MGWGTDLRSRRQCVGRVAGRGGRSGELPHFAEFDTIVKLLSAHLGWRTECLT